MFELWQKAVKIEKEKKIPIYIRTKTTNLNKHLKFKFNENNIRGGRGGGVKTIQPREVELFCGICL